MSITGRFRAGRSIGPASVLALALALIVVGCSGAADGEDPDQAVVLEERLAADGTDPEVASCVLHVGRKELERGELSDAAIDELLVNCHEAQRVITGIDQALEPEADRVLTELAMTTSVWTRGDDPTLDQLWDACEAGSGAACDELFEASPSGSDYEEFGVSCGDRPDVLNCEELDLPVDEANQS